MIFFKPLCRPGPPLALKKASIPADLKLLPIQKKIFAYIRTPLMLGRARPTLG
jgi:hypothetical protein